MDLLPPFPLRGISTLLTSVLCMGIFVRVGWEDRLSPLASFLVRILMRPPTVGTARADRIAAILASLIVREFILWGDRLSRIEFLAYGLNKFGRFK
jgi:hypothetical protein